MKINLNQFKIQPNLFANLFQSISTHTANQCQNNISANSNSINNATTNNPINSNSTDNKSTEQTPAMASLLTNNSSAHHRAANQNSTEFTELPDKKPE